VGEYLNSKQVQFNRSFISCGITEAHHLPDEPPAKTVFAIATNLYHKANGRPSSFVIFSDVVDGASKSRGQVLAEYIIHNQATFGRLVYTEPQVNPRTGNVITMWVLELDHDTFRPWYVEEFANRITELT